MGRGKRGNSNNGSGNFIFDLIQVSTHLHRLQTTPLLDAEAYLIVYTLTHLCIRIVFFFVPQLIAGSGTTPEKDEELNAPREERDDDAVDNSEGNEVNGGGGNTGYNPEEETSGIPGPLTRFALLVNRGIGNIVKDIILVSISPYIVRDSLCLLCVFVTRHYRCSTREERSLGR